MPPTFSRTANKPYSTISINVVDEFGARGDNATDNSPAIESALTELKRRLDATASHIKGHLYFPASSQPYRVSRPIVLDRERIGLVGEDESVILSHNLSFDGPLVVMGIRNAEQNSQGTILLASSAYRPDVFGELDTSVATAANQRWGFRTNNNATVVFEATPGDLGPIESPYQGPYTRSYTAINSGFVLELAVKHSGGTPFTAGITAGLVNVGNGNDTVFSLNRGGVTNQFDFAMRFQDGTHIQSSISLGGSASGLFKLAFQVDLINRRIQGYYNGNQVAISSGGTFFAGSGQTACIENKYYGLIIGTNSTFADTYRTLVASYGNVGMDFSLFGLSLSNGLLYKNNGVGQPQARIDNGTLNDAYRFQFGGNSNLYNYFYLDLQDNPSSPYTQRFLSARGRSTAGRQKGFIFNNSQYTLLGGITGNYIKNLTLKGSYNNACVIIGGVLDPEFHHVIFDNATVAVNCLNLIANYTLRFSFCDFTGYNDCIKGAQSIFDFRDIYFRSIYHNAIKCIASNVNLDTALLAFGSEITDTFYTSYGELYGGLNNLENVTIDFEGTTYRKSVFWLEQYPDGLAPASYYKLKNFYCGTVGTGHVINAVQKYPYDGNNYMILDVENVQTTDNLYKSYLNINGNSILGIVRHPAPDNGCPMTHDGTFTNECNIQIEHRGYKTLPTRYNWVKNGHKISVQNPGEGQFSEFRCIQTGRIGTSGAPRFAGINPLNSNPSCLSFYGYTHNYSSIPISYSGIGQTPTNNP